MEYLKEQMKYIEVKKQKLLRITGLYMLRRPLGGSGFRLARSFRFASFPRQPPPTFLQALETCGFLYWACKNVIYSRTLGEIQF
jgi:hypothetical protein